MATSSDSTGCNESTGSNSVEDECGYALAELVLRNSLNALVVDGTVGRLIVNCMLKSVDVETKMVVSGQEAIELTRVHYDLILVDRHMSDMSGVETIQRMRQRGVQSKIIGLTSGEVETDRAEMMNAGADGCLKRPLSSDALADILAEIDYEIDHQ